jgi:hypothetical protein
VTSPGNAVVRRSVWWLLYLATLCVVVLATLVLGFAALARSHSDLRPGHRIVLANEYRVDAAAAPARFEEYRAHEGKLFDELRRRVLDDPAAAGTQLLGRYGPSTLPAHLALDTSYNRSFELVPPSPRGAVLLVLGLSDSPYSTRGLAETFHAQGYYLLALRLAGRGTIPTELLAVRWRDRYGAVVLAARTARRWCRSAPSRGCGATRSSTWSGRMWWSHWRRRAS